MIDSKKFNVIAILAAVLAAVGVAGMIFLNIGKTYAYTPEYAEKIFNGDIISIEISADADDWQTMLDNAMNEEYISADVTINGTTFSNVGIRPKGNNSLQMVSSSDSDRYSFKIKFDEYIPDQTCYGLDMLILNNMIGDATYMKEYVTFDMMKSLGINTPYYGYSDISVNGEKWGLYFTLEAYNDSYEQRVSGDESGVLYNVKTVGGAAGRGENMGNGENSENTDLPQENFEGFKNFENFEGFDGSERPQFPDMENFDDPEPSQTPDAEDPESSELPAFSDSESSFGRGMRNFRSENGEGENFGRGGGMGAGNSGGSLVYTNDEPSSYPSIFENVVGGGTDKTDYAKVISALKALNSGENIEEYFDVDEILRYLAVHTFVVNLDSYSSEMAQNYYIYEHDGVLQILPWDYNYAWGAFQGGSASGTVNFPIDTPVSGVEMYERPLISKLFENEEYLSRYHEYLLMLVKEYFTDGGFNGLIDELDALIGEYVQSDPTAFFTYDEYKTALEQFKLIGKLRAESVAGQISGSVPSTSDGQAQEQDKLIDSSEVSMNALGSGGGGAIGGNTDMQNGKGRSMGFGNFGRGNNFSEDNDPPNSENIPENNEGETPTAPSAPDGNFPQFGGEPPEMPQGGNFPDMRGGQFAPKNAKTIDNEQNV